MQLLYPSFLWAFVLLAIPVVIHLFQFRRYKTVYFSNVRFLKTVQQESTSRNRLKHLLVLAARLLALSSLILAFAQPFFAGKKATAGGKSYVSVFVDNSFSMHRLSENFTLLDKAKQIATEIVKNFDEQDRFQLLTNNFSGNENRLLSKDEMLAAIEEINFSSASRKLDAVAKRQNEVLSIEGSASKTAFVISDFQQSMVENNLPEKLDLSLNLIPLNAASSPNIGIDTCYFAEPFQLVGKNTTLIAKIKNYGIDDANQTTISLFLNGQKKSTAELSIAANSFALDTFVFTTEKGGWNQVQLTLNDEPVTFDNSYFLSFNAVSTLHVLSLSDGANKFIRAAFGKNPQFLLDETSPNASLTDASKYSLIAVSNLKNISSELSVSLSNYIASGGSVVLFPPFDADKDSYNKFLLSNGALQIDGYSEEPTQVADINLAQNIFKDVFEKTPENMRFPAVKKHAIFSKAISVSREDILKTREGNLLVARFTNGKGNLYVSAVAADAQNSELPVSAIFAPMLFKMAVLHNVVSTMVFTIGSRASFNVPATAGKENVFKLVAEKSEFIPQQFAASNSTLIAPGEEVKLAGFYKLVQPGSDSAIAIIAANYDRNESNMQYFNEKGLKQLFDKNSNVNIISGNVASGGKKISESVNAKPLWKYFLIAALLFLLAETLLLRFWKTEQFAKAT
jgi:hypothetical protein